MIIGLSASGNLTIVEVEVVVVEDDVEVVEDDVDDKIVVVLIWDFISWGFISRHPVKNTNEKSMIPILYFIFDTLSR
ncbi:MAG: hypothetical protein DRO94_01850 [Candidatus Altiarchaeales archaeon]|nr:MAG: hypothetical protein DRO94_01850 [Candidatus Altiarchaeales archaeon]